MTDIDTRFSTSFYDGVSTTAAIYNPELDTLVEVDLTDLPEWAPSLDELRADAAAHGDFGLVEAIDKLEAEPMTIEEADELLSSFGDEQTNWLTTVDRGIDGTGSTLWVEAARRVSPRCCDTQSDPGPAWGWVQHGRVIGSLNAQCGGCGGMGLNWVTSGPVEVGELGEVTVDELARVARELVERLGEGVEDAADRARDEIRERLRGELERAMEIMGPDDLPYLYAMPGPGVGVDDDGVVVAWDFDPVDEDEIIEVRADGGEVSQ